MPPGRAAADLRRFAARTANYVERRARTVSHRLLRDSGAVVDPDAEQAEVLVYFPEPPLRLYQLAQWLPVLERLAEERATGCVVRSAAAHPQLREATSLPLAVLPSYSDLMTFYDRGRPEVLLYVNHGQLNFQSLTLQTALHVQISHGESDKRSSFSNQAKAYDRVFGAGEIAAQRYLDKRLGVRRAPAGPSRPPAAGLRTRSRAAERLDAHGDVRAPGRARATTTTGARSAAWARRSSVS